MPRLLGGANIAGEGLQERLRTATFALLGLVTSVGLILVGIAYNQGWPEFINSPIPGLHSAGIGEAAIVAEPVPAKTGDGNDRGSGESAPLSRQDLVPDRSSGARATSPQEHPALAPDVQAPGPAPSGQGAHDTPGSPADSPPAEPPVAEPPAAQPPAAEPPENLEQPAPAPAPAPVATSPPAATPSATASVPGKGKAKGHEKSHGRPTTTAPAAPTEPSPPPEPTVPAEAPPPAVEGPGNGHGNANGHSK